MTRETIRYPRNTIFRLIDSLRIIIILIVGLAQRESRFRVVEMKYVSYI